MPKVLVASILVFTFLVACPEGPAQDPVSGAIRTTDGPVLIGDAPIHEGRISRANEVFQFRACDRDELYFVDASFSINDTLELALQSAVTPSPIYIRFHGEVIAGVDGLPDLYTDVIKVTDLLSYDASVPVICK